VGFKEFLQSLPKSFLSLSYSLSIAILQRRSQTVDVAVAIAASVLRPDTQVNGRQAVGRRPPKDPQPNPSHPIPIYPASLHSFHLSIYPASIHASIPTIFAMSGGSQKCAHLWFAWQKVWRIYVFAALVGVYLCVCLSIYPLVSLSIFFFFFGLTTHLPPICLLVSFVVCLCVKLPRACCLASSAC